MAEYIEKNKKAAGIEDLKKAYEEKQKASWDTVNNFKQTAKINTALGIKYSEYDNMDLMALNDELHSDEDRKSESFTLMYESLDKFLRLAVRGGTVVDEEGKTLTRDFFESFFAARISVNQYVVNHAGYRWSTKGERRVQLALRVQKLLNNLSDEVNRVQEQMPEEKARRVEYAKEGLNDEEIAEREKQLKADQAADDMVKMIETGEFGPKLDEEAAKKAKESWIIVGYSRKLKNFINDDIKNKTDKDSQNDLLAYVTDQNNRLIANRMAISMLIDNDKEATLNMPWLKEDLKKYLSEKISDEEMLINTPDFVNKVKDNINGFKSMNMARIGKMDARISKFASELNISTQAAGLYDFPEIRQMILGSDDQDFEEKLASVKNDMVARDAVISKKLDELYSIATRNSIRQKLYKNLGALRIFGTNEQVMDQMDLFCEMLKYTAPAEYITEKMLNNVLKDLKIESIQRDTFVNTITRGNPTKIDFLGKNITEMLGEDYSDNCKKNAKRYAYETDMRGRMLTEKQWNALHELSIKSGMYSPPDFKKKLNDVITAKEDGELISRNEYISKRKFRDAQNDPTRIKKAEKERKRIESIGHSMETKFLLRSTYKDFNSVLAYEDLDAAYKGKDTQLKKEREEIIRLSGIRREHLHRQYQKAKIPENRWEELDKQFFMSMAYILEIREDMTEDEKLTAKRKNLENHGVSTWEEAFEVIKLMLPTIADNKTPDEVLETKARYDAQCAKLAAYGDGKYADFVNLLVNIPEIYAAMMNGEVGEFDKFIKDSIEQRLGDFAEGNGLVGTRPQKNKKREFIPKAVRNQYAYSYLREIYEGSITGDADFFADQLINYNKKVFEIRPYGLSSIADNIKELEGKLDKWLSKRNIKGNSALNYKLAVLTKVYDQAEDILKFRELFSRSKLENLAKTELDRVINGVKENEELNETEKNIKKRFVDNLPVTDDKTRDTINKINKQKEEGRIARAKLLRIDNVRIENIRIGKSLVRVEEKDVRGIKLNTSKADTMRGRMQKYCSGYELPQILHDAIVEEGCSETIVDRLKSVMWSNTQIQRHAYAMSKLYNLLTKEIPTDPAMSEEEAQMYIVRLYSDRSRRELFDKKGGPDVE
ncbi:MAG: hypothetical protein K6G03_09130, partial [Lachnospiraceae bacterium]|nr:hypothetical protein [Lachnospiraceae bacterium]